MSIVGLTNSFPFFLGASSALFAQVFQELEPEVFFCVAVGCPLDEEMPQGKRQEESTC